MNGSSVYSRSNDDANESYMLDALDEDLQYSRSDDEDDHSSWIFGFWVMHFRLYMQEEAWQFSDSS